MGARAKRHKLFTHFIIAAAEQQTKSGSTRKLIWFSNEAHFYLFRYCHKQNQRHWADVNESEDEWFMQGGTSSQTEPFSIF